eukprot:7032526-Pyramimonas_sp.AAC.1
MDILLCDQLVGSDDQNARVGLPLEVVRRVGRRGRISSLHDVEGSLERLDFLGHDVEPQRVVRLRCFNFGEALLDLLAEAVAMGADGLLELDHGLLHGGHGGHDLGVQLGNVLPQVAISIRRGSEILRGERGEHFGPFHER